ncbi:MAG: glycoside hydrolase family 19 protein [Syntrophaceae bacterium]
MKGFEVLTTEQLKKIFANARASAIEEFLSPINTVMEKYEINTPLRIAHFLAQVGHESGELRYREELASGEAYDTGRLAERLGNTPEDDDDGRLYKGRGLIQLTGHDNYELYGRYVGIDLLKTPQVVATRTDLCADVAGWFWFRSSLNALADQDGIQRITRRINGGLNGLKDRKRILVLAKSIIV